MTPHEILDGLLRHDLPRSVQIFCPELWLCGTIIALLLMRLFNLDRVVASCWVALAGALVAFLACFAQFMYLKTGGDTSALLGPLYQLGYVTAEGSGSPGGYFTGLLMHDPFVLLFRLGLALFLVLMVALTILSGIPDDEDGPDFYTLLFGATVGMMMAVGANHLLMIFLTIEMMSVPSYVMVGFLKGRKTSSEAALKYVVYGAGAAGIMLYGVSLLAGLLGTANLPLMAERLAFLLQGQEVAASNPTVVTAVLGIMFVLVGLAFKLSLVPFHFWCPDAFHGASAEVAGYLSIASKGAAFGLLVRFLLAFETPDVEALRQIGVYLGIGLGFVAILSTTYGNLAAYAQTNVKRLLAYSTIAHAGYMLMAVAAMMVFVNAPAGTVSVGDLEAQAAGAVQGLMYYLAVYIFMNLSAFAIVAAIRNEIFSEEIADYNGLVSQNTTTKILCVCMAISMFSLIGIPPFAGFLGKLMIFYSVFKAGYIHWFMWVVLAFGGLNTVFSLFYYLNVLKAMFMSEPVEGRRKVRTPAVIGAYVVLVTVPILALIYPLADDMSTTALDVAAHLFR